MATVPIHSSEEKRYSFIAPSDPKSVTHSNEAKQEILASPLRIAEMAIEIQLESLRVKEAMSARDALVQKLSDAHASIREKTELIERLQQALTAAMNGNNMTTGQTSLPQQPWDQTTEITGLRQQIADLEALIQDLRLSSGNTVCPPPRYEEEERKNESPENSSPHPTAPNTGSQTVLVAASPLTNHAAAQVAPEPLRQERSVQTAVSEEPEDMVNARFAVLASIPLPDDPPDDTLKPIILPPTCTLHEFLSATSGTLRNSLGNYRVLQSLTTKWCPNREEHGYFYSPLFKCSTNPRVTTAHRWQLIDVTARMKHPTECFYNREGLWYYAGSYQAFRLEDLTVKEWTELPTETTTYLVKETISGRKNVSPQNIYEVNQLYAAGALKIACVGLQCVGFNRDVYKSVLDHATKYTQAKWKIMNATGTLATTLGGGGPASTTTPGTSAIGNINHRLANVTAKSPPNASRPVSPTLLGTATVGFGAVAASLGLGNGTTWNATAAVLAQSQMMHTAVGSENVQPSDAAAVGYRTVPKK